MKNEGPEAKPLEETSETTSAILHHRLRQRSLHISRAAGGELKTLSRDDACEGEEMVAAGEKTGVEKMNLRFRNVYVFMIQ